MEKEKKNNYDSPYICIMPIIYLYSFIINVIDFYEMKF